MCPSDLIHSEGADRSRHAGVIPTQRIINTLLLPRTHCSQPQWDHVSTAHNSSFLQVADPVVLPSVLHPCLNRPISWPPALSRSMSRSQILRKRSPYINICPSSGGSLTAITNCEHMLQLNTELSNLVLKVQGTAWQPPLSGVE